MGTLALQLAAAGLHVFPCNQDKTPEQGIRWTRQATTNETAIRHWWGRSPDALPAIHLAKSNLVVLDADRHGGPDGVAALAKLERDNEVLPNHPVINTAGGGEHHIFCQPEGHSIGNSEGALAGRGINVRGSGGYIIAPGARRSDNSAWTDNDDAPSFIEPFGSGTIPPLPDWLLNTIKSRGQGIDPTDGPETASGAALPSASARKRAYAQAAETASKSTLRL
jgi:hypothetical protein